VGRKSAEQLVQAPQQLLEVAQPVELLPAAPRPLLRAEIRLKGPVRARLALAGLVSLSVLVAALAVTPLRKPVLEASLATST
jgi:hypothetical protein